MPDKKQLLRSIAAVAKQLRHTPSLSEFTSATGISRYRISQFFPCWNDAVWTAGLDPNAITMRVKDSELLRDWGETVRKCRSIPSRYAYAQKAKYNYRTLERRLGSWPSMPKIFRNFAKGKPEWADVLALLSPSHPKQNRSRSNGNPLSADLQRKAHRVPPKASSVYGNPMDFRGLRHEPLNEQGVVFLFGILAKQLGFIVEAVQKGFPDCEAKRRIGPDRWQRVRIEFEYESRNFHEHGHPVDGCDVIVCWRHNWDQCPKHIEIVELSTVIRSQVHSGERPPVEKP